MKHEYDFLVVGAGLFGATFACMAKQHGKKCLVIDKRSHLGGNVYCEDAEGITVHKYGPSYSIPMMKKCGTLSTGLYLSTGLR